MINVENGKLNLSGSLSSVSAECVLVMGQLYNKLSEIYGPKIAMSLIINMAAKAITGQKQEIEELENVIISETIEGDYEQS